MSERSGLKNFDAVKRPERRAMIGGEEVDVTKIPSRVALELAEMKDKLTEDDDNAFYKSVDLVSKACLPSNPKVTADFLIDNTDLETLLEFTDWVLEPVMKRVDETKNTQAQANKKNRQK